MHPTGPFSIPSIRSFVPEKLKPWIVVVFVLIFQLSGGVYLAAVSEMVGSLALMQEDIMMAGYASLVGMSLTFTSMFRLKFRFASRTSLLICCTGLIACNLICMHTHHVPLLMAVCFVAGILRMWATFECNSTIQLWLTPKRDLSVFFCFICLLVQGSIQLSGLVTVYTAFWAKWEYMHWLVVALLGLVAVTVLLLFRNYRSMRKLPLFGIDWLGAAMWAITLLCIVFICVYGAHYDWFRSEYIRMAAVFAVVVLLLNVWRASFIRHPYIALQTFTYKPVYMSFILYIVIDILLAPSHLFEHIYMEGILEYDALNVISLNWTVFFGIVAGSVCTYFLFARRKWSYRRMIFFAFLAITGYLLYFYFRIDYHLPKELLMAPLFLRGFGYAIVVVCLLTVLSRVPFPHFFQSLSVQAFVSAGFGGALGAAILEHALKGAVKKNALLIGASLDRVHPVAGQIPAPELYGVLQQQALMVSMKELYGWLILLALLCLMWVLLTMSSIRPHKVMHPSYRAIRRFIKHELRMDQKQRGDCGEIEPEVTPSGVEVK